MTNPETDWLENLTELPDLKQVTKTTKAPKKGQPLKHIKGEKHPFIPLTKRHNPPVPNPRTLIGEAVPKVYRSYWAVNLAKATYNPSHMLGISPYWPQHNRINWGT